MDEVERFKSVVRFETPDYWPLMVSHALGTPHPGGYLKLHREGMPEWVTDNDTWCRYWGTCTFDVIGGLGVDAPGIRSQSRCEAGFEIIEYETGARTRQVLDNEITYSMPDFQEFHIRDRASWERYRELTTPRRAAHEVLDKWVARFGQRTRPLAVHCGGTWGMVREAMGPENALLVLYDDPELLRDMLAHKLWMLKEFVFPVVEALHPEIIVGWEDCCYKHGMLLSPAAFREFCLPYYRQVAELARNCGAELLFVDSDGKVDEFIGLLDEAGFNGLMPLEQVCGNDPAEYRQEWPNFIFLGGIEKEIASTGKSAQIESELVPMVRKMLALRGCFPTFDHGLSTNVGFVEHCRCMTRLHELCGSDHLHLGEFPRMR